MRRTTVKVFLFIDPLSSDNRAHLNTLMSLRCVISRALLLINMANNHAPENKEIIELKE